MVSLVPQEFARANRVWEGDLPLKTFDRLCQVVGLSDGNVRLKLQFVLDDNGRVHVTGNACSPAKLPCKRCLSDVACSIEATIDFVVVKSQREAHELFNECDAIVHEGGPLEIQALVEDDLLMSVKPVTCPNESLCGYRGPDKKVELQVHQPFAGLKRMLQRETNVSN